MNYKEILSQKTDEDLVRIVYFESDKYEMEAVKVADEVLHIRNVSGDVLRSRKEKVRKIIASEKRMLKNAESNRGCFDVFLDIFGSI